MLLTGNVPRRVVVMVHAAGQGPRDIAATSPHLQAVAQLVDQQPLYFRCFRYLHGRSTI